MRFSILDHFHLSGSQERVLNDETLGTGRFHREEIGLWTHWTDKRHDHIFPDRIDRRVGHLKVTLMG